MLAQLRGVCGLHLDEQGRRIPRQHAVHEVRHARLALHRGDAAAVHQLHGGHPALRLERHMGAVIGTARAGLGALQLAQRMIGSRSTHRLNEMAHKVIPVVPVVPAATPGPARDTAS